MIDNCNGHCLHFYLLVFLSYLCLLLSVSFVCCCLSRSLFPSISFSLSLFFLSLPVCLVLLSASCSLSPSLSRSICRFFFFYLTLAFCQHLFASLLSLSLILPVSYCLSLPVGLLSLPVSVCPLQSVSTCFFVLFVGLSPSIIMSVPTLRLYLFVNPFFLSNSVCSSLSFNPPFSR